MYKTKQWGATIANIMAFFKINHLEMTKCNFIADYSLKYIRKLWKAMTKYVLVE